MDQNLKLGQESKLVIHLKFDQGSNWSNNMYIGVLVFDFYLLPLYRKERSTG